MVLHYGASRATRDVDMIFLHGDKSALHNAALQVAIEHNLPDHWLNDAAKGFADILPSDFQRRLQPVGSFNHLRLYALGLPDQTAMKIVALRDQDLEDLELLLPLLRDQDKTTLKFILARLETIRPDWAQRLHYFLLEQGWTLD